MLTRILGFLLPPLAGAGAGWFAGGWPAAALGWVLGGLLWLAWDLWSAQRALHWLRRPELQDPPALYGLWFSLVDRVRRLVRAREQATQESEQRLAEFLAAIQASPSGVVLLDSASRIEWCNQTAAEHFGFDATRDVQQHIGNLVRDPAFTAYVSSADQGQPVTIVGRSNTASRPVRIAVQLHPYGAGRMLLLSNDVTAREQAETMRRDFVANVSHEIRTPLTVLAGFIETLQTLPLEAGERARYLALMSQQSHRMQNLVADLLTLSRLEGSPAPSAEEWMPVASLLAQCEQEARAFSLAIKDTSPVLKFDHGAPCSVAGAQAELLSAWSNLVNNALRYTPPGGSVRVSWSLLPDGQAEFAVQDTGAGIAAEHLPRLTERFYRVDRSRSRDTGGTGLGLAIVKHVAQRHGAQLNIQSTPGQGSRFAMVLPAVRVQPLA